MWFQELLNQLVAWIRHATDPVYVIVYVCMYVYLYIHVYIYIRICQCIHIWDRIQPLWICYLFDMLLALDSTVKTTRHFAFVHTPSHKGTRLLHLAHRIKVHALMAHSGFKHVSACLTFVWPQFCIGHFQFLVGLNNLSCSACFFAFSLAVLSNTFCVHTFCSARVSTSCALTFRSFKTWAPWVWHAREALCALAFVCLYASWALAVEMLPYF